IKPVVVIISGLPNVVITNPASSCTSIDLTLPAVTAGSDAGLTFTYWTDAAATTALANPNTVNTSGTYYIKGTTAGGCFTIKPVDITFAAVTAGSDAGLTFTYWTDAAATSALNNPNAVTVSGTCYIKVTTARGCYLIKPVVVIISGLPNVVITNPASSCTTVD